MAIFFLVETFLLFILEGTLPAGLIVAVLTHIEYTENIQIIMKCINSKIMFNSAVAIFKC